tara:strand:- start:267 stop:458 length:192 start_codon:yes stop_codon:yes gene_type:complete
MPYFRAESNGEAKMNWPGLRPVTPEETGKTVPVRVFWGDCEAQLEMLVFPNSAEMVFFFGYEG